MKHHALSVSQVKVPRAWIVVWIIIYLLILVVGLFQQKGTIITIIKLTGVLLCSVYSIAIYPKDFLLQSAMMTTFVADCILACDNISTIGLIVFFITQIIHLYRLSRPKNRPRVFVLALIGLFIIACSIHINFIPPIYIIITFYTITLIANIIASWRWKAQDPHNFSTHAAFYGFLLFGCCDLCTVLSYLALIEILPVAFYVAANYFAWFFYYPSQILVSNSSKCATIETKGR